jgi:hypothetical protein
VSVDPNDPRRVDEVLEADSKLVRMRGELPSDDPPDPSRTVTPGKNPFAAGTSSSVESGVPASDGKDLDAGDFTGDGMEAGKHGLFALEKADLFN